MKPADSENMEATDGGLYEGDRRDKESEEDVAKLPRLIERPSRYGIARPYSQLDKITSFVCCVQQEA
jgi:hypothetical protein